MDDNTPTDPQENLTDNGHLPVSGEVSAGPVTHHDPVAADTTEDLPEDWRRSDYVMNPWPDQMT